MTIYIFIYIDIRGYLNNFNYQANEKYIGKSGRAINCS